MDENALQLLAELANKLGVATEYLWVALLKQANIYAVVGVISLVAWAILIAAIAQWVRRATLQAKFDELDRTILLFCVACLALAYMLFAPMIIYDVVSAISNPEYWALMQIISK